MRFVAPGAPSTGVLDTTLDSSGLMTWHEAAPPAEGRLPAAPMTTRSRQTTASSPTFDPPRFALPIKELGHVTSFLICLFRVVKVTHTLSHVKLRSRVLAGSENKKKHVCFRPTFDIICAWVPDLSTLTRSPTRRPGLVPNGRVPKRT